MADDNQEIAKLVALKRFWRDRCEWERLADCYTEDSLVRTTGEHVPLDREKLRHLRPSYRVWAYMISPRGYEIGPDELGDDRPDLLEPFYAAAERWLEGGG